MRAVENEIKFNLCKVNRQKFSRKIQFSLHKSCERVFFDILPIEAKKNFTMDGTKSFYCDSVELILVKLTRQSLILNFKL